MAQRTDEFRSRSHPKSKPQAALRVSRGPSRPRDPRIYEMLDEADEAGMLGDVTLPEDGYGYYHTVESVHMRPGAGGVLLGGKG